MEDQRSYKFSGQMMVGLILVLLGILFVLDNFGIICADRWLHYWPVLLVAAGAAKAMQPGHGRWIGVIIAFVGLIMLGNRLDLLHFRLWDFWPLILVAMGASMILKKSGGKTKESGQSGPDTIGGTAFLGGMSIRNHSLGFKGGSVTAMLGGMDIDLRDADMPEGGEALLEVTTFMGGVEIRVPDNWSVSVEITPFLGGVDNKTLRPIDLVGKQLLIRGSCVMGGVEIRN